MGSSAAALPLPAKDLAIAEEIGHQQWLAIAHSTLSFIYLDLLDPIQARQCCQRAYDHAKASGARHIVGLAAAFLAWAYLLDRDHERAAAVLDDFVNLDSPIESLTQAVTLAAFADVSLAREQPNLALRVADLLVAWASRGRPVHRLSPESGSCAAKPWPPWDARPKAKPCSERRPKRRVIRSRDRSSGRFFDPSAKFFKPKSVGLKPRSPSARRERSWKR